MKRASACFTAKTSSSSLACIAAPSRFWVFWIRNTIRKVMMVVPVLITSCQVSLNPKIGPVAAQTATIPRQAMKVHGLPAILAVRVAKRMKIFSMATKLRRFPLSS